MSVEQAGKVCRDLDRLETEGCWDVPVWATELSQHYQVAKATATIQLAGWRAVAKAYRRFALLQIAVEARNNDKKQ